MTSSFRVFLAAWVCTVLGLSFSTGASADYYRWINSQGKPVLSDRPPPAGVEFETISSTTRTIQGGTEDVAPQQPQVTDKPSPESTWHKPEKAVAKARIQKDPAKCQQARDIIWTLDNFARHRVQDENGEYRYIDEDEKVQRRREANDAIARFCE